MSAGGAATRIARWLGKRFAPPAFVVFLTVLAALIPAMHFGVGWSWADALVLGFNAAVLAFLAALWPLSRDRGAVDMRRHSEANDANRMTVLAITALVAGVLLVSLIAELPDAREGKSLAKGLLIATLGLSWLFTNVVFALHYAHLHYSPDKAGQTIRGGFEFPATAEPDYWDFLYFSLTAGMSFAASDVNVTSQAVRKVLIFQCLLSFVFNIGALAFCINVLAGGK